MKPLPSQKYNLTFLWRTAFRIIMSSVDQSISCSLSLTVLAEPHTSWSLHRVTTFRAVLALYFRNIFSTTVSPTLWKTSGREKLKLTSSTKVHLECFAAECLRQVSLYCEKISFMYRFRLLYNHNATSYKPSWKSIWWRLNSHWKPRRRY